MQSGKAESKETMLCVYCQERPATEREHVIPRSFFTNPAPSNLVTVPSCHECNRSWQSDEEYFRLLLACHTHTVENNEEARKMLEGPVARALARREGLRRLLIRSIYSVPLYSVSGIYLGEVPALKQDKKRIDVVIFKIIKGLFFHLQGRPLPKEQDLRTIINASDRQLEIAATLADSPFHGEYGNGVFRYIMKKVASAEDGLMGTAWVMSFYDGYYVLAVTARAGHRLLRKWDILATLTGME